MLDSIVGAVIMLVATSSLLLSIEVAENAFRAAGRYPLNDDEEVLLHNLDRSLREQGRDSSLQLIGDIEVLVINDLPRQYQ